MAWNDETDNYVDTMDRELLSRRAQFALKSLVAQQTSGTLAGDFVVDYIVSGLLVPSGGAIGAASLPAGVAYITGKRVVFDGAVLALTDGSDNYVDLDRDGNVIVSVVTKNAGAPAKATNSIRLGKVVTTAGSVTSRVIDAADSNGNWMGNYVAVPYSRVVNSTLINYAPGTDTAISFGAGTNVYDNAGMHSMTVQPTRFTAQFQGLYEVVGFANTPSNAAAQTAILKIFRNDLSAALGNRSFILPDNLTMTVSGFIELRAGGWVDLRLTNPSTLDVSSSGLTVVKVA
jgi:hypothetical protein